MLESSVTVLVFSSRRLYHAIQRYELRDKELSYKPLHSTQGNRPEQEPILVYRFLRAAIARHIGIARRMEITADDVTIINGTQQGLYVVARTLIARGDMVAVEDPVTAGIVPGYGAIDKAKIKEGLHRLRRCFDS